ncbi:MAG: MFS transporter [Verrucomicrobiota bacterium]
MSGSLPIERGQIRWSLVGLLMALCFLSHMNRVSMSVAADERIMSQYGFNPTQMGFVYSAFLLVYTVCMIPGGAFIDRFGARKALMVVGFGSAFFVALTGLAGLALHGAAIWVGLMFVRGAMGFFTTPLHPGCARAVCDWTSLSQRSLVNGLVTGAALVGVALTYKTFGSLLNRFDWPMAFFIMAVVTAGWGVAWTWATRGIPEPERQQVAVEEVSAKGRTREWIRLLTNRNLLLVTFSYAAIGYFQYLFFYWMHYYFKEVLKLGDEQSKFYAGIPPFVMAFGMPLGGWFSDRLQRRLGFRWGRTLVPLVGMLLGAAMLVAGVFAKHPMAIVTWFSLALGVVGACEGSFWSTAVELGGGRGGTTAAVVNTGGNAGGLLAPVVTPWISQLFGWHIGITLGGVICLLGALCWCWINPDESPEENLGRGESMPANRAIPSA